MKVFVAIAMLCAFVAQSYGLKCKNSVTGTTETCIGSNPQCYYSKVSGMGTTTTTYGCNSACSASNYEALGVTTLMTCCNTDECNTGSSGGSNGGSSGSGKQCYSCTSALDSNCAKGLTGTSVATISCSSGKCAKTMAKVLGLEVYTRSCDPTCTESSGSFAGMGAATYCCEGDKCNSATAATISFLSVLGVALVALFH